MFYKGSVYRQPIIDSVLRQALCKGKFGNKLLLHLKILALIDCI